jgi:PAS domain S-box-containing protein
MLLHRVPVAKTMIPSPDVPKLIQSLLGAIDLLVAVVSPDFTVLDWNGAAERWVGYPATEAFGRDLGELLGGGEAAGTLRALVSRVLQTGQAGWADANLRPVREAERPFRWIAVPVVDERGPAGAVLVGTDLTARRPADS